VSRKNGTTWIPAFAGMTARSTLRGIRTIKVKDRPWIGVPVKPRRPPSLPLFCMVFPDHSSFSVLRETPMTFSCDHFKKPKFYGNFIFPGNPGD
jgi:hypothetical protein